MKNEKGEEVPYGPLRYKQIVAECYKITKNLNTSYTDLMKITPTERSYLLEFIDRQEDMLRQEQEKLMQKIEAKSKK